MGDQIRGPEGESSLGIDWEKLNERLVCSTCGAVVGVVSAPGASQQGLVYHHELLQLESDIKNYSALELPLVRGHDHLVKESEFQASA